MIEDIYRVRVKFSEVDSMRVAWHGSYVKYLEDGRESFGRHHPGIGYADMLKAGVYAPVYDVHIRYLAPLSIDDIAVIFTRYIPRPGARIDMEYEIRRASDGRLCAQAQTVQLFTDPQGQLLTSKPEFYEQWQLRNHVLAETEKLLRDEPLRGRH